jgi:hypothetical protein
MKERGMGMVTSKKSRKMIAVICCLLLTQELFLRESLFFSYASGVENLKKSYLQKETNENQVNSERLIKIPASNESGMIEEHAQEINESQEAEEVKARQEISEGQRTKEGQEIEISQGTKESQEIEESQGTKESQEIEESQGMKEDQETEVSQGTKESQETEESQGMKEDQETEEGQGTKEGQETEESQRTKEDQEAKESQIIDGKQDSTDFTASEKSAELEEQAVNPMLTIVDSSSVIVTTFAELKQALEEDNGYTTVYLGADIEATSGIAINANKSSVIIDGHSPEDVDGIRHTYKDRNGGIAQTISVKNQSASVVVKNLIIEGKNYYGMVSVTDSSSYSQVQILYDNIDYTGAQLIYNRYGKAIVKDSTVNLIQLSGGDAAQELAEVSHIVFQGKVEVKKSGTANSMLWMTHAVSHTIEVSEGADVTLQTPGDIQYNEGSKPTLTIRKNASLNVECESFSRNISTMYLETVSIEEGADLSVRRIGSSTESLLDIGTGLFVSTGGSLTVISEAGSGKAIQFRGTSSQISIVEPERIVLYHSDGKLMGTASGSNSISVNIIAKAYNIWNTTASFVDTMDNMPTHIWNKRDSTAFEVSAKITGTTVSEVSAPQLLFEDPILEMINAGTFKLSTAYMFTAGESALEIDEIGNKDMNITGITLGGASTIQMVYDTASGSKTSTAAAGLNGIYSVSLEQEPLEGSYVTGISHLKYLKSRQHATVVKDNGSLQFKSVPEYMSFRTTQIAVIPAMIPRADESWEMIVEDTRLEKTDWEVSAIVKQPLQGSGQSEIYTLDGALGFVDESGRFTAFSSNPILIYQHEAGTGNELTMINWPSEQGVLVSAGTSREKAGITYKTDIEWVLTTGP